MHDQQESPPPADAWFKRLGAAGPLAIVAAILPGLAGIALFWKINVISEWLKSHGDLGVVVYAVSFALLAGFALLPTYAQAILGGWAFGVTLGAPAALLGFLGGAWIGYEIGRLASHDRVRNVIDERPKWKAVREALLGGGFWKTLGMVTLLRLPPNSPFAITNLVLAGVKVARPPYLLGTLIGMTPRTVLAVMIGAGIKGAFTKEAYNSAIPVWMKAAGIFVTVAIVAIIGHLANKAVERVTRSQPTQPT